MALRVGLIFGFQRLTCRRAGKGKVVQRFIAQDPAAVGDGIQQLSVMRDQHKAARPVLQEVFQPEHGRQVQVVAGFIQQEQVRLVNQRPGQQQAGVLPAAQRGGVQHHILRRKAHACQQRFGFPAQAIALSKRQLCEDGIQHGER